MNIYPNYENALKNSSQDRLQNISRKHERYRSHKTFKPIFTGIPKHESRNVFIFLNQKQE